MSWRPLLAVRACCQALWHSPNGRVGLVLVGVVVAAAIAAASGWHSL